MAVFPSNLQTRGYRLGGTETRDKNTIETDTDHGPREIRREYTARSEIITLNLLYNDAEMEEFWDWYDQDIQSGATEIELDHPRTRLPITVYQMGSPPVFRNTVTSGTTASPDCYWEGSWTLRVKVLGVVSN